MDNQAQRYSEAWEALQDAELAYFKASNMDEAAVCYDRLMIAKQRLDEFQSR